MVTSTTRFAFAGRATVFATVAAVALTAVAPSMALAAPPARDKGVSAAAGGVTDVSARRRVYRHGGGGAAAAAAFAGIVGTGLAIAAAQNRRADYDDYYGRPYAPAPYYYGGGPYYGGYEGYGSSVPYVNGHPIAGW
jgi:hypothetical protein